MMNPNVIKMTVAVALIGGTIGAIALLWNPAKARVPRPSPEAVLAATGVSFPVPGPKAPAGLTVSYDEKDNETTMQLEVSGLSHKGASNYGIASVRMVFISDFKGRERRADEPERSVKCVATAHGSTAGFFAVSSPPARFSCTAGDFDARDPAKGVMLYKSKAMPGGGVEERVNCRVRTEDLVRAVGCAELNVRFGAIDVHFSRAQVQELREFVARMK
ncbi:MAG: hypothetical protein NTV94_19485 [Planctomycetota bacterium]|nr:hypothetical protein [Planctomycetota bacterium]